MYSSSYRMANVQGRFFNRLSISARKVKDQHKVEYNGRRGLSNNIWRNKIFTVSTHSSNPAFIYRDSDAPLRKIVRKKEIRHYWPMRNDSHYDLQFLQYNNTFVFIYNCYRILSLVIKLYMVFYSFYCNTGIGNFVSCRAAT